MGIPTMCPKKLEPNVGSKQERGQPDNQYLRHVLGVAHLQSTQQIEQGVYTNLPHLYTSPINVFPTLHIRWVLAFYGDPPHMKYLIVLD